MTEEPWHKHTPGDPMRRPPMTSDLTAPDPSLFHYYDQPQEFTVHISVSGTYRMTVQAASRDEAKQIAEERLADADERADMLGIIDLDDVDDVAVSYASANPTRTYLVTRPSCPRLVGTSRLEPGDQPRPPCEDDRWVETREGYSVSWKPEDVQARLAETPDDR